MAKIQAYLKLWLSKNEHLGYDEYNVPHIDHMKDVAAYQIKYWEYHGYRKERTYYTKRKPSFTPDKVIASFKAKGPKPIEELIQDYFDNSGIIDVKDKKIKELEAKIKKLEKKL